MVAVWDWIRRGPAFWDAVPVFAMLWMFCMIWAAAFEIRITDDMLRFRSLFGGIRCIRRDEIKRISVRFDLNTWGGPLRIWVYPKNATAKPFSINTKVFTSEAVRAVRDLGEDPPADSDGLDEGIVTRALRKRRSRSADRDV